MAFNPKELVRVAQANTRTQNINYDLAYSENTKKFRVSDELFSRLNLEDNGLTLLENPASNMLVLISEPNDVAVMYKGREGSNKGREFTSSRLRLKLNEYGLTGNKFTLSEIDTIDGVTFYEIKPVKNNQDTTVSEAENAPESEVEDAVGESFHPDVLPEDDSEVGAPEALSSSDLDNLLN